MVSESTLVPDSDTQTAVDRKPEFKKLEARLSEVEKEVENLKKAGQKDKDEVNNDPADYTHHIRFTEQAPFISQTHDQFFIIGSALYGDEKRERKEIGVRVGGNRVNLRIGKKRLNAERLFTPKGELEDITLHLPRWNPSAELRGNKHKLLKDIKKHLKDEMGRLPEIQRSKVLIGQGASKTSFFGEDSDSDDEEEKRPFKVDDNDAKAASATHDPDNLGKRKQEFPEEERPPHKRIKNEEHEEIRKRLFSGSMENKQKQEGEKQKRPHEIYSSLFEMLDKTSPYRDIYRKCMEEPGQNLVSRATAEALRRAREQNK
ncbi:hypothetical protein DIS24_g9547 [Lasiodiplodia hormozganensis]|uniref:Uncharacterized protein n=1 Tax=Lasiodiplodia hormozganensis TaxID=869390 RepID=A0AA39XU36_9PEZI|nr:hypothetical protein DIS24_g9547 [Lasiodiplodia hormozganensis]